MLFNNFTLFLSALISLFLFYILINYKNFFDVAIVIEISWIFLYFFICFLNGFSNDANFLILLFFVLALATTELILIVIVVKNLNN